MRGVSGRDHQRQVTLHTGKCYTYVSVMLDSFTNKPIVCIVVFCSFFLQKYCYGMYIV